MLFPPPTRCWHGHWCSENSVPSPQRRAETLPSSPRSERRESKPKGGHDVSAEAGNCGGCSGILVSLGGTGEGAAQGLPRGEWTETSGLQDFHRLIAREGKMSMTRIQGGVTRAASPRLGNVGVVDLLDIDTCECGLSFSARITLPARETPTRLRGEPLDWPSACLSGGGR
ncbi:hypothetical protein N431DRAFT_16564 [Stipitochalara longipes BDJ]|nr:hypothetical protein N431DRAFT_16564 [Stipitochalara longipes BDJ]